MAGLLIVTYALPGTQSDAAEVMGKFLQLRWRDQEYLVFAPLALHRYHNQLLAHFLDDNAIAYRWLNRESLELTDPGLKVTGGGRFRVNGIDRSLTLWDDSHVYGRFHEPGLAEKIAGADHPWHGFNVTIS